MLLLWPATAACRRLPIRFVPDRLRFTTRTWQIDVPKVVVFMKLPLPPPGSPPHHYFSTVDTLVINVRFLDEEHLFTTIYDQEDYNRNKYLRPNVVLVFADADAPRLSKPKATLEERRARFDAIVTAVSCFRGRQRMHWPACKSVTVVGIDEVDPTMFGLRRHQVPSLEICNALHSRHLANHCCQPNISCEWAGCRHSLKFYSMLQYKILSSSEEFAVDTVWNG